MTLGQHLPSQATKLGRNAPHISEMETESGTLGACTAVGSSRCGSMLLSWSAMMSSQVEHSKASWDTHETLKGDKGGLALQWSATLDNACNVSQWTFF